MGKLKKAKSSKSDKDAKAKLKEQKKDKATKKAATKDVKQVKKAKGKDKAADDWDEDDLIRTLEEYRNQWAAQHKVSEEVCDGPPSRRANASLTPCPVSTNLWLLGGEYYDGNTVQIYSDLYRYSTEKNEWRRFTSPTAPGPRSAHQVVASPAGGGRLWLFGGEFSAPNQSSFHHYRDLVSAHSYRE